ncbi:MAG: hypothetical protein EOO43_03180, partial [Flavobacterium sp.]
MFKNNGRKIGGLILSLDMISLFRTTSTHPDFIELVKALDAYLAVIDGDEHSFYAQFNKIDTLKNVVIAFENGKPYLDIETVKKACKYLQADHISSFEELQQNFQKNFI